MRRFSLALLCLIAAGCQPDSSPIISESAANKPQIESPSSNTSSSTTLESDAIVANSVGASAKDANSATLKLVQGEPNSKLAPRYSPPGKGLKLEPFETPTELGFDGLQAEVVLGASLEKQTPVKLLVKDP